MVATTTRTLLEAYLDSAPPGQFLSNWFDSPPMNFYTTEEINIDIIRDTEDVAIVIQDIKGGYRMNSADLYTSKGFKPPIFREAISINQFDLLKRQAGDDPFQDLNFRAQLLRLYFLGMTKIHKKINRARELQASQVLQTGQLNLADETGTVLYSLNFQPKATHFPTAGTSWDAVGSTPIEDLNSLAEVIRDDGLDEPDTLLMGAEAFIQFLLNDEVKRFFTERRIDQGTIAGFVTLPHGGYYRGQVVIGNYRYDVITYGGRYTDPQTGFKTQFMDPKKVVIRASSGRLDATYGAIPNIRAELGNSLIPELPNRMESTVDGGMDIWTNIWLSEDGTNLLASASSRPLMIPTGIDTFGCITVLF